MTAGVARDVVTSVLVAVVAAVWSSVAAQQPPAAAQAPRTPRAAAPIDLTGYWVSVITEEWRWRMVTPAKGDYSSIPISEEGRRVAGLWDPATDGSCKAYGAAGLMRMPTRLNITWQGDDLLKVESDAGQQTRVLRFGGAPAAEPRSLQGVSIAAWEQIGAARPLPTDGRGGGQGGRGGAGGPAAASGTLKVTTSNLLEGWLRRNGIPYSDTTTITEYWDRVPFANGDVWLIVTQYVNDPKYLLTEYTTSMHFKREADGSKWKPTPCRQV